MGQFASMVWWGIECTYLILISPIGWALAATALLTGYWAISTKRWPAWTWAYLAWPLLMSAACILWGQTHWHESGMPESKSASIALNCLVALYLAGVGAAICLSKGARAATTSVLSLGSFTFLGCAFVAGMAITGTWL